MIPRDYITEWRTRAPWIEDFQVEQNLIISRALVEMFSNSVLAEALAFRGGTALYKLYLGDPQFSAGMSALLTEGYEWEPAEAARAVSAQLIPLLPGEPWKQGR